MHNRLNILIIDECEKDRENYTRHLENVPNYSFDIQGVNNGNDALNYCSNADVDIVLLDYHLSDYTGLELFNMLNDNEKEPIVIMITREGNEGAAMNALKNGVHDYLIKDAVNAENLTRAINNSISKKYLLDKIDKKNSELLTLAHYDNLTGLLNRFAFEHETKRALAGAKRHERHLALIFLDIDDFKVINDVLGHHIGDLLLTEVASRIKHCIREEDLLGRIGGDEFAITLTELHDNENAALIAQKIIDVLKETFVLDGKEVHISGSLGIACFSKEHKKYSELMKSADLAMYRAKELGKNNFQFYTKSLNEKHVKRLEIETALREALKNNQFHLVYQPQFDLESKKIIGVEVLLRWEHPSLGNIEPRTVIQLAEELGLISEIGDWILQESCKQYSSWCSEGLLDCKLEINLSVKQLVQFKLEKIQEVLLKYNLEPSQIIFDISERSLLDAENSTCELLHELHEIGYNLTIGDIFTEPFPLQKLCAFPIDMLKVDHEFLCKMGSGKKHHDIVKSIIDLANNLELDIIAEGIESEEQSKTLLEYGCKKGQGFYFSAPQTVDVFNKYLREQK